MTPIMQKILDGEEFQIIGDCFRSCVASLLDISKEGVPDKIDSPDYSSRFLKFLYSKNLDIYFTKEPPNHIEYYIGFGMSPKGIRHSVIYKNNEIIHDPDPNSGGIVPDTYAWLQKDN